MMDHHFLTPVLALIVWTLLIWCLMYARRLPAMKKVGMHPDEGRQPGAMNRLPDHARWAADNHNHLHEQPVLFYALMFYLQLVGQGDSIALYMAWAYVAFRVLHSIVQVTANKIVVRFALFCLGSFVLMAMAARAVYAFASGDM